MKSTINISEEQRRVWGLQIRAWRMTQGWTQQQFAWKLALQPTEVSKMERGMFLPVGTYQEQIEVLMHRPLMREEGDLCAETPPSVPLPPDNLFGRQLVVWRTAWQGQTTRGQVLTLSPEQVADYSRIPRPLYRLVEEGALALPGRDALPGLAQAIKQPEDVVVAVYEQTWQGWGEAVRSAPCPLCAFMQWFDRSVKEEWVVFEADRLAALPAPVCRCVPRRRVADYPRGTKMGTVLERWVDQTYATVPGSVNYWREW